MAAFEGSERVAPVEAVEYAKARGIYDEPVLALWVPFILQKRNAIIAAIKHRGRKTSHKYGIKIPISFEHVYALDKANSNTFRWHAIKKEMFN
eukprot:12438943-Ditylum_brightwellii.AAC.1